MVTVEARAPSKRRLSVKEKAQAERKRGILDPAKVKELAAIGVNPYDIARHQGVSREAVWQFLDRLNLEKKQTERFKENRADVFANLQGKAICVQEKLLDHLMEDGVLTALEDKAKVSLANSINNIMGTAFDKERLERGQSTQNHSLITKMMGPALKEAGKEDSIPNLSS